ncbi:MAG: hypothetical protein M5U34_38955 [Chloroflexi bacterium]|nr:hypothetical protein [Chloroflexota bacterium]
MLENCDETAVVLELSPISPPYKPGPLAIPVAEISSSHVEEEKIEIITKGVLPMSKSKTRREKSQQGRPRLFWRSRYFRYRALAQRELRL